MRLPDSGRKKALFVIDVQPSSITERTRYIVPNIQHLIQSVEYDLYFEAIFFADKGSIWDQQQKWVCPKDDDFCTVSEIAQLLAARNAILVEKSTKSIFKGNKDIEKILLDAGIKEIHLVGMDTSDCVLASAYEAFDLGFITYLIEECCQTASNEERHQNALSLLRQLCMTNHSFVENIDSRTI